MTVFADRVVDYTPFAYALVAGILFVCLVVLAAPHVSTVLAMFQNPVWKTWGEVRGSTVSVTAQVDDVDGVRRFVVVDVDSDWAGFDETRKKAA